MTAKSYFKWMIFFIILISGCSQSDYDQYRHLVKRELGRGVRQDSLFLGIKFGMTTKDFYAHCWELNKKGLITDGNNNTAVLYKLTKEFQYPVSMNFYPDFRGNRIYKMRTDFSYDAWAPWNKRLFSDSLQLDVVRLYKKWYGDKNFISMSDSLRGTIFIKVDGNRRIIIGRYDDMHVKVDYTDLLVDNEFEKK
jgi:hypothetical protein